MVKLRPNLIKLKAFGSDGEKNVHEAFKSSFPTAKHLLCTIHMKDNIKRKCLGLGIVSEPYIEEIFRKKVNDTKIKGLMDCNDEKEFDVFYDQLRELWVKRPKGVEFSVFMDNYKRKAIKDSMLVETRKICGLGDPPEDYTQNANESINSMIKRGKASGKLSLKDTIQHFHREIQMQEEKVKLALVGKGNINILFYIGVRHLIVIARNYSCK